MMTLHKLIKYVPVIFVCLLVIFTVPATALAVDSHEDPDTAPVVYSGVALLAYYTDALDMVLQLNDTAVEEKLGEMPFAHIPADIVGPAGDFAAAGTSISHGIVRLDENIVRLNTMLSQYRLDDVGQLEDEISRDFSQAYSDLNVLDTTAHFIGDKSGATAPASGLALKDSYASVLDRIEKIRQLLNSYQNVLTGMLQSLENILENFDLSLDLPTSLNSLAEWEAILQGVLIPTNITLNVTPMAAFVGDKISFQGILNSREGPLSGREVEIILNGSSYGTVITEADGSYQGSLNLPYEYIDEMSVQALYYPRGDDTGYYLSALSPAVDLKVLYYRVSLELMLKGKSYPGRESDINGSFVYDGAVKPVSREIEIYFDDVWSASVVVGEIFSQQVMVPAATEIGQHILTVVVFAMGRYAPVIQSIPLQVIRADPVIDIENPRIIFMPGVTSISGRVYSEIASLENTTVKLKIGAAETEVQTEADGIFRSEIKKGYGSGLFGIQPLVVSVSPQESWYNSASITRDIQVLNTVNCGGALAIIIYLSVLIRRRIGKRLKIKARVSKEKPVEAVIPVKRDDVLPDAATFVVNDRTPAGRLLLGYRWTIRLIVNSTGQIFHPQWTLREFAREVAPLLGPAAGFFDRLTEMVEKLFYSGHNVTDVEVEEGKQLAAQVEQRFKE